MDLENLNKILRKPFDTITLQRDNKNSAKISNNDLTIFYREYNINILKHELIESLLFREDIFKGFDKLTSHFIIDFMAGYESEDYINVLLKESYINFKKNNQELIIQLLPPDKRLEFREEESSYILTRAYTLQYLKERIEVAETFNPQAV